jgi:hypothetical protein
MKPGVGFVIIALLIHAGPLSAQPGSPILQSITPGSVRAGSTGVALTLNGSGFTTASIVRVNGESLPTTFIDASTLRCLMPDSRLATPAALSVVVFNTDTSGSSQTLLLPVYSPSPPTVTSINPAAGLRGTTMTATVSGTNLIGAVLQFGSSGIMATSQAGTEARLPVQISITGDAPFGAETFTVSTPSGSTTVCGPRPCTFAVVDSGSWTPTSPPLTGLSRGAVIVKLLDGRVLVARGKRLPLKSSIQPPSSGRRRVL